MNYNINSDEYYMEYLRNDLVKIDNFLNPSHANFVHEQLKKTNSRFWDYLSNSSKMGPQLIKNTNDESVQNIIKIRKKAAFQEFCNSQSFSYSFYRMINSHTKKCNCDLCQFENDLINNFHFEYFIREVTGINNLKLIRYFYTEFKSGDFLYPHTNAPNSTVCATIFFTKNWKPWYGGKMNIIEKNNEVRIIKPKFNSLVIKTTSKNSNPHFVDYIPQYVKSRRFAMVFWFM